ncbi:hypothetical protein FACS189419_00180 [Planctomycetales bacterium]|nr:hypothetical protein FACS189419_00180 [Planctomycetales bacterium]
MKEFGFTHFLRSFVLLALLISIPGIAVGWNVFVKKQVAHQSTYSAAEAAVGQPAVKEHEQSSVELPPPPQYQNEPEKYPELTRTKMPSSERLYPPPLQLPREKQADFPLRQVAYNAENPAPKKTQQDFKSLEEHLKSLGAVSYKLEKWGSRGSQFRFSCLVALAGNLSPEKKFQAIGDDEIAVMQTVLSEIERWEENHR